MNEKLKKLAVKLSELIPKSETPQEVYDGLIPVMQKQSDYFKYLGPDNIVKLTFYIYSFKTTGKFNVGDNMISSLGFANVFTTEGNEYIETCNLCDGEGELDCENCNGGEIRCVTCDGDGEVTCPACDGSGSGKEIGDGELEDCEVCNGTGNKKCEDCDGYGYFNCDYCDNGKYTCEKCGGDGEIETTQLNYDAYLIVTWNRDINGDLSLNENSKYPALSEYDFDRLRDEFIILTFEDDGHAEFQDWVKINEMYCTFYSDEPKLNLTEKMKVDNRADSYEPDYYTT
jgi:hypothetical protein